ncbi:MAG: MotA/TolQ/ExbB proton channel family protein [Candidatus Dependentiae bacterium]|nr:MotA/TolQ/ExbB proton channel family protein [Candidatus Dependentiae bacterium]
MVAGNSLWHLVVQTDAISKSVLVSLLFMSILIWTVFLCKAFLFYRKKRDIQAMIEKLSSVRTFNELIVMAQQNKDTLPGYFLAQSVVSIERVLEHEQSGYQSSRAEIKEHIRAALEQEIDLLVIWQEQYTPLLSTSAVISPLLGLLGTVWGLIHAFMSISQTHTADIATVAPGIAEALTTTLAGLIVAIPAVVMVNYVTAQIVHIEQQLVRIADYVMVVVQRSIIHKKENICVDLAVGEQKEVQQ